MSDFSEYLTIAQAMKKVGCSRRSLYRILERLGPDYVTRAFGKTLIPKSSLAAIKAEYAPPGSAKRHQMAVEFGRLGGTQKGVNYKKAKRKTARNLP